MLGDSATELKLRPRWTVWPAKVTKRQSLFLATRRQVDVGVKARSRKLKKDKCARIFWLGDLDSNQD